MAQQFQVDDKHDVVIEFPDEVEVLRLEAPGRKKPVGMKLVDFVFDFVDKTILLEIKDPSSPGAVRHDQCEVFRKKLKADTLIAEEFVPKARDSYTYLHLMRRDTKPFVYVVLLGLDAIPNAHVLLDDFKGRLTTRLLQETDVPWKRRYIAAALTFTFEQWNVRYPHMPITRTHAPTAP